MAFSEIMVAPCGINCGVCRAFLRKRNKCCGCLAAEGNKQNHCNTCSIKQCEEHEKASFTYCYQCAKFPCNRMKKINKRYVENYRLSLISNQEFIRHNGIKDFIDSEDMKWKCKNCGEILCVHKSACINCSKSRFE